MKAEGMHDAARKRPRMGQGQLDWWARKLFGSAYEQLDAEQQRQAQDARAEHYDEFTRRGRTAKKRHRSARLREKAANLLAEADSLDQEAAAEEAALTASQP